MLSASFALCASLALSSLPSARATAATWQRVGSGGYTGRSDSGFSRCGTKLCLLGGRNGPAESIKPADVFDTKSGAWTEGPAPPIGIHHFQIAPDPSDEGGDCVWAGGAWQGFFPVEETVDRVYQYCAGSEKWSDGPEIARPRGGGGAVTYDGKYYLVAGNVGGHGRGEVKSWFDVYDPKKKEWAELDDVPNPRDHFFATVIDDKLYVAGGRDGAAENFFDATEPAVDVYDFKKEKWSTIAATFPTPRGGALAASHAGGAVYGGGESGTLAYDDFYFFDGNEFTKGPDMLTPRHGTGYASCGGALYTAGGVSAPRAVPEVKATEVLMKGTDIPECKSNGFESPDVTFTSLLGGDDGDDADGGGERDGGSDDDDENKCFPASATVELESGAVVSMVSLQVGDRVRVADGSFSDVYFFSHKDASATSDFYSIRTSTASLSLTAGHLLSVNGKLASARSVVTGDIVSVLKSGSTGGAKPGAVIKVTSHSGRGLYNPHTLHGTVVVDGLVTSCLTDALAKPVAGLLLQPFKYAYKALGSGHAINIVNEAVLLGLSKVDAKQISFSRLTLMLWSALGGSDKAEL